MAMIGKRVVDDQYVHLSAVDHLQDEVHRRRIREAAEALCAMPGASPNVAKICLRTGRLSLLSYPDFDDAPFPELAASWIFAPGSVTPTSHRVYADSLNPPILHRKELLVPPGYPGRDGWATLTLVAEQLGLFDDTTTIGFRVNWERLVAISQAFPKPAIKNTGNVPGRRPFCCPPPKNKGCSDFLTLGET